MSCGIENPQPIEECTGPSQCCPSNRRHGGTEEQENADGSYSARHLVPISFVGARAWVVLHLLNILKLESAEYLAARAKLSSVLPTSYGGSSHLKLGDQFEFF
jgi:hypothetical protein